LLGLGLCLIAATGCGSSASVSGKVTYKGTPLKGGSVSLVPDGGGQAVATSIQEDGTYSFPKVRTGKYKLCVETSSLKPPPAKSGYAARIGSTPKGGFGPPPGAPVPEGYKSSSPAEASEATSGKRYVEIPPQYEKAESTPLSLEVKSGNQQHDIPLD
jgi:hypothetical protein